MAYVRVEFITLGIGPNYHGRHENVIDKVLAHTGYDELKAELMAVTITSATTAPV